MGGVRERGVFEGREGAELFFLTKGVRDFMSSLLSLSAPPAPKRLKRTPKTDGKVVEYHDERQDKIKKSLPHELASVEGIVKMILDFEFEIHEWVMLNERMTVGRSKFHTVLYGDKLFVIGGEGWEGSQIKSVEYANLKDLKKGWEMVDAEMAYERSFDDSGWGNPFKAVLIGGRLFVSGGENRWKNGFLEEKEEFLDLDDMKKGWKTANGLASLLKTNTKHLKLPHEKFNVERKNFAIAKYEKKMFVLGGEIEYQCEGLFASVKYLASAEYLRLAY